ncbi:MAG: hypothetical protein M1833_004624 [Piccolia ochrophora]|nr:MAG: hypothetical protein M1833_004624 [Piccolia ochrophora]
MSETDFYLFGSQLHWAIVSIACIACTTFTALLLNNDSDNRSHSLPPRGYRRLDSTLDAELADACNDTPDQLGTVTESFRIRSIWIYPVKSCQGIKLSRAEVRNTGLRYDRQFCFAQARHQQEAPSPKDSSQEQTRPKWEFLTQRQYPLLARIKTEIWIPDESSVISSPHESAVRGGGFLICRYPHRQRGWRKWVAGLFTYPHQREAERSFRLPLEPTQELANEHGFYQEKMTIWKDSPQALNMGSLVPEELGNVLGLTKPMTLFRVEQGLERKVFRCAPREADLGWQPAVGFADAASSHTHMFSGQVQADSKASIHCIFLTWQASMMLDQSFHPAHRS